MTQASLLPVLFYVTSSYSVPEGSHASNTDHGNDDKEKGEEVGGEVYVGVVQRRCEPQADLGLGLNSMICK